MTNEWALYSGVCSLLALTHLLCPSCLDVLISLQRAEINSSKKAGQGRKKISWQFRGISHGLQGGIGLDLSERLRLGALWEDLLFPNPYLSFCLNATFFPFLMVLQYGFKIPRKGTRWLVLVDCLALIMCQLITAYKGEDSRVQRHGIFCHDYLGVE